jgi:hypothetical protein
MKLQGNNNYNMQLCTDILFIMWILQYYSF